MTLRRAATSVPHAPRGVTADLDGRPMRPTTDQSKQAVPLTEDDEEDTDAGASTVVLRRCVPCAGTGSLVAVFEGSVASRRRCLACDGKGLVRTVLTPGRGGTG